MNGWLYLDDIIIYDLHCLFIAKFINVKTAKAAKQLLLAEVAALIAALLYAPGGLKLA